MPSPSTSTSPSSPIETTISSPQFIKKPVGYIRDYVTTPTLEQSNDSTSSSSVFRNITSPTQSLRNQPLTNTEAINENTEEGSISQNTCK